MKFTAALALPLAVSASPLSLRATSWESYDQETTSLSSQGLCRTYTTLDPPERASGLGICDDTCASAREITSDEEIFSVSCIASGQELPSFTDPDGATYNIGECVCNHPIVNEFAGAVVEGLPGIGLVTCAVWKLAAKESAELIAGTIGTLRGNVQSLAKAAKALAKLADGSSKWEEWVKEHSDEDACDFSVGQLFEDFTGLSEDDLPNV